MKKFDIAIRTNANEDWDSDCFQDYIEAETAEEAAEFAKDYINENGGNAENYMYLVSEMSETEFGAFEPIGKVIF